MKKTAEEIFTFDDYMTNPNCNYEYIIGKMEEYASQQVERLKETSGKWEERWESSQQENQRLRQEDERMQSVVSELEKQLAEAKVNAEYASQPQGEQGQRLRPLKGEELAILDKALSKSFNKTPTRLEQPQGVDDSIYDSIYMEVVELVEKDNIQCEEYRATAKKLEEKFTIIRNIKK